VGVVQIQPVQNWQQQKLFDAAVVRWDRQFLPAHLERQTLAESVGGNPFSIEKAKHRYVTKQQHHSWKYYAITVQLGLGGGSVYSCVLVPLEFHIQPNIVKRDFRLSQEKGAIVALVLEGAGYGLVWGMIQSRVTRHVNIGGLQWQCRLTDS